VLNRGLIVLMLAPLLFCGCQTAPPRVDFAPGELDYAADADSLGQAAFLQLGAHDQQLRRNEARQWRRQAVDAVSLAEELRALRTAVGLDPGHGPAWLRLARRSRWFGDYDQAEKALAGFAAALPHLPDRRHELAGEAALITSWLRYDRGEWRRGVAWADSAAAHGAGEDAVQLLQALHQTGLGRNRRAEDIAFRFAHSDHRAHWICGVSYWRRGGAEAGHAVFTGRGAVRTNREIVSGPMLPEEPHAAECFRDYARVEEILGNWWQAKELYESSMAFVPGRERANMVRVDHSPLGLTDDDAVLPVWLAFDRYYITGSLSAYTDLAFRRFQASVTVLDREFWGAAVVDAAGSCVRLGINTAFARRARGLVLAEVRSQWSLARQDLTAAQREFDRRRHVDTQTLSTLGRLHLRQEHPAQALPLLERAVAADPRRAQIWSDLGLARVQLGQLIDALAALEKALALDPNLAVAYYNRGLLRFHMNELDAAVADVERAHELAPNDQDIESLLTELNKIRESGGRQGS